MQHNLQEQMQRQRQLAAERQAAQQQAQQPMMNQQGQQPMMSQQSQQPMMNQQGQMYQMQQPGMQRGGYPPGVRFNSQVQQQQHRMQLSQEQMRQVFQRMPNELQMKVRMEPQPQQERIILQFHMQQLRTMQQQHQHQQQQQQQQRSQQPMNVIYGTPQQMQQQHQWRMNVASQQQQFTGQQQQQQFQQGQMQPGQSPNFVRGPGPNVASSAGGFPNNSPMMMRAGMISQPRSSPHPGSQVMPGSEHHPQRPLSQQSMPVPTPPQVQGPPSVNIEQPHSVQSVHSQQPQQQQQQQPQPQQIPQLQQPSATQTAAYKTKLMQMRVHYDDLVKVRDRMKRDRVRVDRLDKMLDLLDNKLGNVKCDVQFLDRMHSSIKQLIHKHTIGRPLLDAMNTIIKENRKMDNWMPFPDPWANFKHMEIKVPDEVVKIMAKDGNADYVAEAKRRRLIGPESDVQAVPDLKISEAHPAVAELEKIEIDCQQGTKKFTFTGPASAELGAYDWDVDTPPMSHHAESAVVKIRSREFALPPLKIEIPNDYPTRSAAVVPGCIKGDVEVVMRNIVAMRRTNKVFTISDYVDSYEKAAKHILERA